SHLKPSAFKLISNKNFSSMQNLCPAKARELENSLANGLHMSYAKVAPTSVGSSLSSPSHPDQGRRKNATNSLSQDEETMSDSGHNSMNSLPPYRPPFRPHLGQISASMGHINHIGSWDHISLSSKSGASIATDMPPQSMVTLSQLQSYGSEASQSCELSHSLEDVVQDLEDQLLEKEHELKQMRKNLDESEDAIAQVFEGKQRLWEKEVEELKRLYATKLRQVSQYAQHSQHTLQLQLNKVQQDCQRLQEDLEALQRQYQNLKGRHADINGQEHNLQLEESQWKVCQKSGEIALLKQQLRDSQAEVAQKLSEIFCLKTRLHEAQCKMRAKDDQIDMLQLALQQESHHSPKEVPEAPDGKGGPRGTTHGGAEDRLRAELILERRQNEAQASAFEAERRIWHMEKEKVIRYQKELQASYLEMYHRNQVLEKELLQLRGGSERHEGFGGGEHLPSGLPWIDRIESSEI
ncbi:leucine zipper putative tumor suppressor 3, partial [Scleropages formosus]